MKQFDVYQVSLDPAKGAEMKKTRPSVIISPDQMNAYLNTVIVAPLTHTIKGFPSRVQTNFKSQFGEIALDQLRAVDKSRLKVKSGKIDATTERNIKLVLLTMFS